jgi:hypothetical protein
LQDSKDYEFENIFTYLRRPKFKPFSKNESTLFKNKKESDLYKNIFNKFDILSGVSMNSQFGTKKLYKENRLFDPNIKFDINDGLESVGGVEISDYINNIKFGVKNFSMLTLIKKKLKLVGKFYNNLKKNIKKTKKTINKSSVYFKNIKINSLKNSISKLIMPTAILLKNKKKFISIVNYIYRGGGTGSSLKYYEKYANFIKMTNNLIFNNSKSIKLSGKGLVSSIYKNFIGTKFNFLINNSPIRNFSLIDNYGIFKNFKIIKDSKLNNNYLESTKLAKYLKTQNKTLFSFKRIELSLKINIASIAINQKIANNLIKIKYPKRISNKKASLAMPDNRNKNITKSLLLFKIKGKLRKKKKLSTIKKNLVIKNSFGVKNKKL